MATSQIETLFPYGTFPIDPLFSTCYAKEYSRASSYSLPDRLPCHHPVFRSLEGTYSLAYTLPPWWQACVAQVKVAWLKPLLATVSAQEFRAGCIEQSRWKAFRETLADTERRQLPSSPKIGILLAGTDWMTRFRDRGPTTTPDRLTLTLSTSPLDFLYMSNGQDWTSCQHLRRGGENHHLPGNFYDTTVAIATVRAPTTRAIDEDSILARTTLRVFLHQGQPVIVVGRTYHNNETLALLFLRELANLFDTRQLAWGFMTEVNALFLCQDGTLGADLAQRIDDPVDVTSECCWFPHHWYVPYIDGGESDWEHDVAAWDEAEYYSAQLHATICPMQPRVQPCLPTINAPARLTCAGMLPPFL